MRSLLAILLISFLFVSCDFDDDPAPTIDAGIQEEIRSIVDRIATETEMPGAVVAVKYGNRELFDYAWGLSDMENNTAMESNMKFRIGSVTKTFTAIVVLQLVDEGLLNLGDIISAFEIEGIDWNQIQYSDEITIEQLLNMTSGLYNYTDGGLTEAQSENATVHFSAVDTVQYIYEDEPENKPGEACNYTNTAYQILGLIVEEVTGNSIGSEITSRIINKYGFESTSYPEDYDVNMPEPYAHGYWYDPVKEEIRDYTVQDVAVAGAAGAIISDVYDLIEWTEMISFGSLISPELFAKQKTWNVMGDGTISYGYGMMNCMGFIGHSGNISGYSNFSMRNPELDLTIVVYTNTEDSRPEHTSGTYNMFKEIAELFLENETKGSSTSEYKHPQAADYSSLSWSEAFEAAHSKFSREYAFTQWKAIDFNNLHAKFFPEIVAAEAAIDFDRYYRTLRAYLFSIPDGHVMITPPEPIGLSADEVAGGFGLAAAELDDGRVVAAAVTEGGPAAGAGIQIGSEILAWNGAEVNVAIENVSILWSDGPPATDENRRVEQVRFLTRAQVGDSRTVVFRNPGKSEPVSAVMTAIDDDKRGLDLVNFASRPDMEDVEKLVDYRILDSGYGYMRVYIESDMDGESEYAWNVYDKFEEAIEYFANLNVPGLIVDLRGNMGGSDQTTADLCGFFYEEARHYENQFMYNALTDTFQWVSYDEKTSSLLSPRPLEITPQSVYYGGPVIALVNPACISSGEGIAMGIQKSGHGYVVGFFGTNGSFGITGGNLIMPFSPEYSFGFEYPVGRSLDAEFVVQLDSGKTERAVSFQTSVFPSPWKTCWLTRAVLTWSCNMPLSSLMMGSRQAFVPIFSWPA